MQLIGSQNETSGPFSQVMGFEMFALSVLYYVAQLYTLPEVYAEEVLDISAKFMLGPGGWFTGKANHPFFRAREDIGMKAVPRCGVTQVMTICYLSTRKCLRSAGSRIGELERKSGPEGNIANLSSVIYHSPFDHGSRVCTLSLSPSSP